MQLESLQRFRQDIRQHPSFVALCEDSCHQWRSTRRTSSHWANRLSTTSVVVVLVTVGLELHVPQCLQVTNELSSQNVVRVRIRDKPELPFSLVQHAGVGIGAP